jgi:L-methionine (R)-S-oxide reductase
MEFPHNWNKLLAEILTEFSCQTATLHHSSDGVSLQLVAQIGVPDFLLDKINEIPFGKGIAGVAAATQQPVELCNLQQDLGGIAKAAAQQTGVAGSIAVPLFSAETAAVIGTLGIGKFVSYHFSASEKERLAEHARRIASAWAENPV